MEQSPSREASSSSTSQEIPRILLSPKVSLQHSQDPFTYPILSQINPVHISPTHFLKIHFNIILPPKTGSSKCSFSLRFPHQNPVCTSPICAKTFTVYAIKKSLFNCPSGQRVWNWGFSRTRPTFKQSLVSYYRLHFPLFCGASSSRKFQNISPRLYQTTCVNHPADLNIQKYFSFKKSTNHASKRMLVRLIKGHSSAVEKIPFGGFR